MRALPVATRHDERQARAGVLDARLVRSRARKERAGVVGAALQDAVQEAATDPEAYASVRARRGTTVSAGVDGRVEVGGRGHATYLFAPVTMMMGRA